MYYEGDLRIALVHDELTRRGGAEVVFEELIRLFPQAHLYTLYAGSARIEVDDRRIGVRTSFLQRMPLWFRRHPARLLPLLPQAAEQFDLSDYDLVISSSSGFSKAVVTRVNTEHWCYCHTPTRYLWDATHQVTRGRRWLGWLARLVFHYLRLTDYAAAQRVDRFIANSKYTERRVRSYYQRESQIIHPPIDTIWFTPSAKENKWQLHHDKRFWLCVGRLSPSKQFDQAVKVMTKLDLPLVVIGTGAGERQLKKVAGRKVKFVERAAKEELRRYYRQARALIQPGREDFGMATAESLACGTPVIAYGQGGVSEIVEDGLTGVLYEDQSEEALAEAIRRFLMIEKKWQIEQLQSSVLKFNKRRWQEEMLAAVSRLEEKRGIRQV